LRRIFNVTGLAAVACAFGLAMPAAAEPRAPRELGAKEITWSATPNGDDIAKYYPQTAFSAGVSGWTVLQCQLGPKTSLKACTVLAEAPTGYHFGDAGLKLSRLFRLKPAAADADIAEGDVINLPIVLQSQGKPAPRINYMVGRAAVLLTVSEAHDAKAFGCLPSRPALKCEVHDFFWDTGPTFGETAALVRTAVGPAVKTSLTCGLDAERRLTACKSGGEPSTEQEAAMQGLSKLFVAPAEANDKTPTSQGRIVIDFDWPVLRAAIDAGFLTGAR
jgi:hypothetical protein